MNGDIVKQWTAVVTWDGVTSELVDVCAATAAEARGKLRETLDRDYEPGGKVIHFDLTSPQFYIISY